MSVTSDNRFPIVFCAVLPLEGVSLRSLASFPHPRTSFNCNNQDMFSKHSIMPFLFFCIRWNVHTQTHNIKNCTVQQVYTFVLFWRCLPGCAGDGRWFQHLIMNVSTGPEILMYSDSGETPRHLKIHKVFVLFTNRVPTVMEKLEILGNVIMVFSSLWKWILRVML